MSSPSGPAVGLEVQCTKELRDADHELDDGELDEDERARTLSRATAAGNSIGAKCCTPHTAPVMDVSPRGVGARVSQRHGASSGSRHGRRAHRVLAVSTLLVGCTAATPPSPKQPDDQGPVLREGDVTFVPASDGAETPVWLCRSQDGRVLARVFSFDDGPDPLSEGLRRYVADEKWGFVDARCRVVIPAVWDFVEPFSGGRARACVACTRQRDGEHWRMVGGRWSVIDRSGREH